MKMKLSVFTSFFLFVISLLSYGEGERILFLTPIGSKSHKIFFMGFVEALANRGHHVTMVSTFVPSKKIENIRDVVIQNVSLDSMLGNIFEDSDILGPMVEHIPQMCLDGLGQKQVQDLKNEHFDLVIVAMSFEYCYLSLVHHFKVPFIYVSPLGLFGTLNDMVGNPDFPSITGNKFTDIGFPLSFYDRLLTTGLNFLLWYHGTFSLESRMFNLCTERGLCPPDMPNFNEIHKNVSLAIINSVRPLEHPPRPTMPNVIYAGGAHIKPSKPLPQDLEEWIEGSGEDGFIFFSLGSALNPSFLPEQYRKILVKVFGSLKQRVLWKWEEETMPDLPKNVKLSKWLPQQDILAHPKLRVFITHGGLLSTLESTYHGIPIIGMPVFADQYANMGEVEKEGWGRTIQWKSLEEEKFRNLLQEVLNDKKMRKRSEDRSRIMKDRLVHPADEAAYWVEYVMRHKGASHIKSPLLHMRWHEIYNMDVWAFIVVVLSGTIYLIWLLLKFSFRKCRGTNSQKKSKRE